MSAGDIWAVGSIGVSQTLTEHWDGTSWSIVASPNSAQNQNELFGVTALSDGIVAAVGHQEDVNTDQPLILQNAASAPKKWPETVPLAATADGTRGTWIDGHAQARLAHRDAALVDHLFAAAGKAGKRPFDLS